MPEVRTAYKQEIMYRYLREYRVKQTAYEYSVMLALHFSQNIHGKQRLRYDFYPVVLRTSENHLHTTSRFYSSGLVQDPIKNAGCKGSTY